jgi:hypothetical protein
MRYRPIPSHLPPAIKWAITAGQCRAGRDQAMHYARQSPKMTAYVKMARNQNRMMLLALRMAREVQS